MYYANAGIGSSRPTPYSLLRKFYVVNYVVHTLTKLKERERKNLSDATLGAVKKNVIAFGFRIIIMPSVGDKLINKYIN